MLLTPSQALLSSSFRYADQRFLWARMRLFEERLEFAGLGWRGLHRRTLPLDRIKELRWWAGGNSANLALLLHGGERIRVHVKAAGLWKHKVESRAPNLDAPEAMLPGEAPPPPASRQQQSPAQQGNTRPSSTPQSTAQQGAARQGVA